jgi:hypothetical protein
MAQPPHTMQLAGQADWAPMIAIHDALRRDLDQLLHATASHASARARWAAFRSQLRFHLAAGPAQARQEAAAAIAICTTCPVRGHCLTLSLQHWDIGQHGVWGGLIAADRARFRRRMAADQTAGRGITGVRDDDPAVTSRV